MDRPLFFEESDKNTGNFDSLKIYYPNYKKRKFFIKELELDFIYVLSRFLQASSFFLVFVHHSKEFRPSESS